MKHGGLLHVFKSVMSHGSGMRERTETDELDEGREDSGKPRPGLFAEVDGKYGTINKTEIPVFHSGWHFLAVVPWAY